MKCFFKKTYSSMLFLFLERQKKMATNYPLDKDKI
jgi:hypothetical protein